MHTKTRCFLLPLSLVTTVLAFSLPAQLSAQTEGTVVVDNPDAKFEGSWTRSTNYVDKYGKDNAFSSTVSGTRGATATFRPNIPVAGLYYVEIWYVSGENRATNAPWLISYETGKETLLVNQRKDGHRWNRISAALPFAPGNSGYVQLSSATGNTGSVVVADAVRFVPADGSAVSAAPVAIPASGNNLPLNLIVRSGGNVTRSPDLAAYPANSVVKLTATADEGYVFNGWKIAGLSKNRFLNPLPLPVTAATGVTAEFVKAGIGVIIDDNDPEADYSGSWANPSTTLPEVRYENFRFASAKSTEDATARFRPVIPKTGRYDVYTWHSKGNNRSKAVQWTVSSQKGQVRTTINQMTNGGEWVPIASGVSYQAGSSDKQYVELSNASSDASTGKIVIADAVAFVYIGP